MAKPLPDKNWINRKEVLDKTGVTASELNSLILSGIIPEPMISESERNPLDPVESGFFPGSVVWRIKLVKRLKAEGEAMENIAGQFGDITMMEEPSIPAVRGPVSIRKQNMGFSEEDREFSPDRVKSDNPPAPPETSVKENTFPFDKTSAEVNLLQIDSPAYLVNSKLQIAWINPSAEALFFESRILSARPAADRNIFKLMFGFAVQSSVKNWQDWMLLHMSYFQTNHTSEDFDSLYPGISDFEIRALKEAYRIARCNAPKTEGISLLRLEEKSGVGKTYQVQLVPCTKGLLYIYSPVDSNFFDKLAYEADKKRLMEVLLGSNTSGSVPLCVLSGVLQDADHLAATLLPDAGFKFLDRLNRSMETCCRNHKGFFSPNNGKRFCFYFFKTADTNYIADAIGCALEMQEKLYSMKGPSHDRLFMNIGIAEGTEFVGTLDSHGGLGISVTGDTVDHAEVLSAFGKNNSVWITKSALAGIAPEALGPYEYGLPWIVQGKSQFIPGIFSNLSDLMEEKDKSGSKRILELPVAQIRKSSSDISGSYRMKP